MKFKTDSKEDGMMYTANLLRRMGDKGWELVDITTLDGNEGQYGVFKRPWDDDYQGR